MKAGRWRNHPGEISYTRTVLKLPGSRREEPSMSEESKREKFVRLAEARVNRALKDIALIGNLSASQYESTPEQVAAIMGALRAAVENTESKYAGTTDGPRFTL